MKTFVSYKCILLGLIITVFINGCSASDEAPSNNSMVSENIILFSKSAQFNWEHLKVEVSFEDDLQNFKPIDSVSISGNKIGYTLSENNIKQGVTVKLKVIDLRNNLEKTNEIMIESFDLKSGLNQLRLGYIDYKPYIIY